MPTDPAILAQLQTLWGEPVSEITTEAEVETAFVPFEWQSSPIPPTRLADSPATWNASTAELIVWFQSNRDRLPDEPFNLKPGVRVVDPALWYGTLDRDITTGPTGARGKLGGLADDLECLKKATCLWTSK